MARTTFGGRKRPGKKTIKPGGKVGGGSSSRSKQVGLNESQMRQLSNADWVNKDNLKAYRDSGSVVGGRNNPRGRGREAITPERLERTDVINLPTQTVPVTPGLDLNMNNAALGADSTGMFSIPSATGDSESVTAAKEASNVLGSYLEQTLGIGKPVEGASEQALADARRQAGVEAAQREFNRYSNQINAITAKRDADQLSLEGQGRGITDTIIGGQQARIGREAAIQALPIQAQLAAAQGNLEQAQQLMGQLFAAKSADIQADLTYRQGLASSVMSWATSSQQAILSAKQADIAQRAQIAQQNLAYQRQLGLQALEYGQNSLISGIAGVDPSSPTFEQDIAAFTSQLRKPVTPTKLDTSFDKFGNLINMQTGEVIRAADIEGGLEGSITLNDGTTATPDEMAYARQYASTGSVPSGLSSAGVSFGRIAEIAAQLPKPKGTLVSRDTGVAPSGLSATDLTSFDNLYNAINTDLPTMLEAWDEMNSISNIGGTGVVGGIASTINPSEANTRFESAKADFLAKLLVARSGAAVTEQEYERYAKLIPTVWNTPMGIGTPGDDKLTNLNSQMTSALEDKLSSRGLSIYGYSTVNTGGQEYIVGEVVTNEYGQSGRINPDGSITLINQ